MIATCTCYDSLITSAPKGLVWPTVVSIGGESLMVTDWNGRLSVLGIQSGQETQTHSPLNLIRSHPSTIYGLSVEPMRKEQCLLITRAVRFFIWQIGTQHVFDLYSESGRQVHSAAFCPSRKMLAVGTGDYPLDHHRVQEAYLELWSFEDGEPKYERSTVLPGVCVDNIVWHDNGAEVFCITGTRSQRDGFLIQLDLSLNPLHYWELGAAMHRSCDYRRPEQVLTLSRHAITCLSTRTGFTTWEFEAPDVTSMAYDADSDQVVLSNGFVIDARTGTVVYKMPRLEDCTSITVICRGSYAGVSSSGILRRWSLDSTAPTTQNS